MNVTRCNVFRGQFVDRTTNPKSVLRRPSRTQSEGIKSIRAVMVGKDRDSVTVRRSTRDSNSHTPDRLQLVPQRCSKTVHFIRHGEGFHNIGYEGNVDAHLTPYGWHQAAALGEHIRSLQPPLNLELVVVSPLMRTCETAAGVFGGPSSGSPDAGLLMKRQDDIRLECSAHDAIALPTGLPFVAEELVRERMGSSPCDSRRPLHITREHFPGIDFAGIDTDEDVQYEQVHEQINNRGEYRIGESEEGTEQRGLKFLKWLMARPESRIAVVAHAGIIRHTLSAFASGLPAGVQPDLTHEFANCEMRSMVLSDTAVTPPRDTTRFPGGREWEKANL